LDRCAAIIVSSSSYLENSPTLTAYKERCRVIPYGVPIKEFDHYDPRRVQAIRKEYGERIVLAVGRLVYYKGFKYLIRAMKEIPARLLLVGQGTLGGELKREVSTCGVGDRVAILEGIDEVAPYYHASDVFVLPSISRTEAFGIVQLEAMACGKPVVNTEIPTGAPGVSLSGVTGLTVPPADPGALAAAINLLLDKADVRLRYGQAARRRVEQEYSVEMMTARILQVYNEVLGLSQPQVTANHTCA
jgi:rhamnosyl/mannosyltransferase